MRTENPMRTVGNVIEQNRTGTGPPPGRPREIRCAEESGSERARRTGTEKEKKTVSTRKRNFFGGIWCGRSDEPRRRQQKKPIKLYARLAEIRK